MNSEDFFKQEQRKTIITLKNIKAIIEAHHLGDCTIFDCGIPCTMSECVKKWDDFIKDPDSVPLDEQAEIVAQAAQMIDIVSFYLERQNQPNVKIEILGGFKCANSSKEALKAGDIITVKEESARIAVESGLAKYVESVVE